jgi:predicted DCC family thiol-disulfide oxidoreductase YuxK
MATFVLFDGACEFCRRSIALLQKLDWLGRLSYVDVRDETQPLLAAPPVAGAPLLEQMHVLTADGRRLYGGYRAVRAIAWRVPLTWLIAPFLYLPGQRVYMSIARNRFKLIPCQHGVCTIQRKG